MAKSLGGACWLWQGMVILLLVGASGCRRESSTVAPQATTTESNLTPLTVLVLDDSNLAESIRAEWSSRSEGEVTVRHQSSAELFASGDSLAIDADVLVYPSALLGELVERQGIVPIPSERLKDPSYDYRDILDTVRTREMAWGEQTWGLSFGSPCLVLYYRTDIFNRLGLKPSTDWSEYQAIAARLADRSQFAELPQVAENWSAVLEPLGPDWAGLMCLARAAAYARHPSSYSTLFDYRTMQPLVDQPSFVRALHELSQVRTQLAEDFQTLDPASVRERFYRGEAAMAITWPGNQAIAAEGAREVAAVTGFAPLPGAAEVFNFRTQAWEHRPTGSAEYVPLLGVSGRLGSVTRASRQPRAASRLLMWFTGPELGSQISRATFYTGPFRHSHLGSLSSWLDPHLPRTSLQQFTDVVQRTQSAASWLVAPFLPGSREYLQALDEAVRETGPDKENAEAALKRVAERWQEITARRGIDAQKQAYARSLGLLSDSR